MSYEGYSGHLVSITSAEENQFVFENLPSAIQGNYWIGGLQNAAAPDYSEPAGGWRWVTGENFNYLNWQDGEPNDGQGFPPVEDKLQILSNGKWNDSPGTAPLGGYVVEYDVPLTNGVTLLEIIPAPVKGGKLVVGQVTLDAPAASGGVIVTLSSSDRRSARPTQQTLTIPEGELSATFSIKTRVVNADKFVTITATANNQSASRLLIVKK